MGKYFGDAKFYKKVMMIALPIMLQNGVTNFVALLDNMMVGQIGTEPMSGVAIANQLLFVYNLCVFGAVSGASIFGAQFFGKGDYEGVRHAFHFKYMICTIITIAGILLFYFAGDTLISLYLHQGSASGDLFATLFYGRYYLWIMLIGLPPFVLSQIYSSTLRESGSTILPMKASFLAVFVNLVFNYLLIFGKFGFPKLGVNGAAVATVIARFVECFTICIMSHKQTDQYPFFIGIYKNWHLPKDLVKNMTFKSLPLMLNEYLWASGMATLTQIYSIRGLDVVAAYNISSTMGNLCNVVFIAMGNAIGIIIGHDLGANKIQDAKDNNRRLIIFTEILVTFTSVILIALHNIIPNIYNTTESVRQLAGQFMIVAGLGLPVFALMNSMYFTLRSGGKVLITFLFDSCYVWVVEISLGYALCHFTSLSIVYIYFIVTYSECIKCFIGYILIKKGVWLQNIVNK